jgi:hypothetical protein
MSTPGRSPASPAGDALIPSRTGSAAQAGRDAPPNAPGNPARRRGARQDAAGRGARQSPAEKDASGRGASPTSRGAVPRSPGGARTVNTTPDRFRWSPTTTWRRRAPGSPTSRSSRATVNTRATTKAGTPRRKAGAPPSAGKPRRGAGTPSPRAGKAHGGAGTPPLRVGKTRGGAGTPLRAEKARREAGKTSRHGSPSPGRNSPDRIRSSPSRRSRGICGPPPASPTGGRTADELAEGHSGRVTANQDRRPPPGCLSSGSRRGRRRPGCRRARRTGRPGPSARRACRTRPPVPRSGP